MILVRFYTEDERRKIEDSRRRFLLGFGDLAPLDKKPEVLDWQSAFSLAYSGSGEPPFRDSMSVDFLEGLGITFVDGDWYSVIYNEVRMPLSSLDEGIKITLSAIACSRRGNYMWFSQLERQYLDKMAGLPIDILFAICQSELEDVDCIASGDAGCKFVNFPLQDSTIEVVCRPYDLFDKDCYRGILYGDDGRAYVHKGTDGIYYCDEDVSCVLQYHWWEDIDNVIKHIDSCRKTRVYLARPSQTYSLLEFGEVLAGDENAIANTEYLRRMRQLEHVFHIGRITAGAYETKIKELQDSSLYDQYLYFRDRFKVICHMAFIPEEPEENLVILSVNKYPDGTYNLTGDKTYFISRVCDAISSMFFKNCGDYTERVSLVFRQESDRPGEDYISSPRGMVERTVLGFKATEDCVEIYDTYEAVQVFGAALKEAQELGKCTGYKWVRRVMRV